MRAAGLTVAEERVNGSAPRRQPVLSALSRAPVPATPGGARRLVGAEGVPYQDPLPLRVDLPLARVGYGFTVPALPTGTV